jgi:predicted LPLAT superfamily acyltransferase
MVSDKQPEQQKNDTGEKPVSRKRGNRLGFWIFEMFIRIFGLYRAYGLLYFVSLYYIIFDKEAVSSASSYIEKRFTESGYFKKYFHIYKLFISQGRQLIDRFSVVCSKKDNFNIKTNGYEKLADILKNSDKGLILLTSHFGNWQIALTALNKLGKKVFLLMRKEDNEAVRDFLNVGYEEGDINIISPAQAFGGVIEIMNALGKGHVVSIMGDRRYGAKASKVKLLGCDAYFPFSAFAIAASAQCPIVVLLAAKVSAYEYVVDVTNIVYPICSSRKKDLELVPWIQKYADILEDFVNIHPYQCFLFYDIWRDDK